MTNAIGIAPAGQPTGADEADLVDPDSTPQESVFCEVLTARTWLSAVLPFLIRRVYSGRHPRRCYYVDASRAGRLLARLSARLIGISVERLDFRLVDVKDEEGRLIRLRVSHGDLAEVQNEAVKGPAFQAFARSNCLTELETAYLAKCVATVSMTDRTTMWRALQVIQIAAWRARREGSQHATLILDRRPWQRELDEYASQYGVTTRVVRPIFRLTETLRRRARPNGLAVIRTWRNRLSHAWFLRRQGALRGESAVAMTSGARPATQGTRIAIEYHGQFNLNNPGQYSDLFFWQESSLEGNSLLLTSALPQDPIDAEKFAELQQHGVTTLALYPGATTLPNVPLFTHASGWGHRPPVAVPAGLSPWSAEWHWMQEKIEDYDVLRDYWAELFAAHDVNIYFTWYRFDGRIYPLADAMRRRGGITAIYQRSFQIDPLPDISVDADLMFGFSPLDAEVERQSGSRIDYHVAVGYTAGHQARYCKPAALEIRKKLLSTGARHVVAYFDENSADDSRWHTGHEFMRENYLFILEQLLADRDLALVLKPKRPSSLRRRLGPVADVLERALATGRCYLCETGPLHGSDPPVVAALAADLVVHGHLCAATAGLEAALSGVPTLLLDREGWPCSPLYALGPGRVVFTNWMDLWSAVREHLASPGSIDGFGNWYPMIEQLDPFRDGRGAERIGTYLDWVNTGLRSGSDRESVLANAAERYAAAWGDDKIARVDGRSSNVKRAIALESTVP